jgi:DNA invertase Pin-like site-specific DNA recombinase
MDGYVRISRVAGRKGPAYISPDVQKKSIQGWADYRNVEIARWEVDEDESGGSQNRPGLRRIMDRIEAGETDGIACWRLNRFARNVAGAVQDVERIQAVGGVLAFVDEDIDPTGPFGSFVLTVLLAVATLERDNIKAGWETAQARAMDRGVKLGPTPFGYTRLSDSTLAPHSTEAELVSEAYRLAALAGVESAAEYLRHAEPAREWNSATVRRTLARPVYLGDNSYGGRVEPDGLPALIDRATWTAAQSVPRRLGPRVKYPLSRIARCAECGGPMTGSRGGNKLRTYRCTRGRAGYRGTRPCFSPVGILAEPLEELVRDALRKAWGTEEWGVGSSDGAISDAEQELERAEKELDAFGADHRAREAFGERYHQHLQDRADALTAARAAYRIQASRQALETRGMVAEMFDTEDPAELRELFSATLDGVVVRKGRGRDRARIIPKGGRDHLPGIAATQDQAHSRV